MENKLQKLKTWFNSGISYESFNNFIDNGLDKPENFDQTAINYLDYIKMNKQRSSRIEKTYFPDEELISLAEKVSQKQYWMVITEEWCGDSAQNLPYVAKIAGLNKNIEMRIVFRDENLELMDMYLTNGKSRSIPKLVAFDDHRELFIWGPRPAKLQAFQKEMLEAGEPKEKVLNQLHLWYGRNKGAELVKEFKDIFRNMS